MRLRWMWCGVVVVGIPLALLGGCTATHANNAGEVGPLPENNDATSNPPDEQHPSTQPDGGPTSCDLKAEGLQFATEACQTCMQSSCCALVIGCVKTDPTCALLQQCLIACPKPGKGGGGGDGGGGGGGDGGGKKDGGDAGGEDAGPDPGTVCRDACYAKSPNARASQEAYNSCISGPCGPACVGGGTPDAGKEGGGDGGDGGPKDGGDSG